MAEGMSLFIDNAKTFVNLSTGALVLTVAFARDILGVPREKALPRDIWLIASWVFFLITIIMGSFYQYSAAKYLVKQRVMGISLPFGAMLISFYAGALGFTVMAIRKSGGMTH